MKAILFDLDDTLCLTTATRRRRLQLCYEALRAELPDLKRRWFYDQAQRVDAPSGWLRGATGGRATGGG